MRHSLLSTLDSLSTAVPMALRLFVTVVLRATCSLRVPLRLVECLQHERLCIRHISVSGLSCWAGQRCLQGLDLVDGNAVGERHLEHDEEIAELIGLFVEGKALVWHRFQVVWLDHLARLVLYPDLGAVQVQEHEVDPGESLLERDFLFNQQVGTLPLKALVWLLLHNYDDITWLLSRILVGLTVERVLAIVGGAFVDRRVNNFLFLGYLLALTSLALVGVVNDFTLAAALIAGALTLRVHAWSELSHLGDDTTSTAR